jgi:hypothetical protein
MSYRDVVLDRANLAQWDIQGDNRTFSVQTESAHEIHAQ